MAIALHQSTDSGDVTSAAVASVTLTLNNCVTNNLLVVFFRGVGGSGVTASISGSGWTQLTTEDLGTIQTDCWYKLSAAGGTESYTISFSSGTGRVCAWMGEYSGVDTSTPVEDSRGWKGWSPTNACYAWPGNIPTKYNAAFLYMYGVTLSNLGTTRPGAASFNSNYAYTARTSGTNGWCSHVLNGVNDASRQIMGVWDAIVSDNAEPTGQDGIATISGTGITFGTNTNRGYTLVLRPASGTTSLGTSPTGGSGAFVQGKAGSWTTTTAVSVTLTTNTTVGNLLIFIVGIQGVTTTVSSPGAGWNLWDSNMDAGSGSRYYVYWKVCAATSDKASGTFTLSVSSSGAVWMGEYSGLNIADPTTNGLAPQISTHAVNIINSTEAQTNVIVAGNRIKTARDMMEFNILCGENNGPAITAYADNWSNRANVTNSTRIAFGIQEKSSLGAGVVYMRATNSTPGAGFLWSWDGYISFAFQMKPDGSDHWGWAEGSDAMDSWQLVEAF